MTESPDKIPICLIVDDSLVDQRLIARALKRAKVSMPVRVADSLAAARMAMAENRVGLILLDNTLPDGHGADFAMELSRTPGHAGVPVAIVTDWPSPFMFEKARLAKVRAVLPKRDLGAAQLGPLLG